MVPPAGESAPSDAGEGSLLGYAAFCVLEPREIPRTIWARGQVWTTHPLLFVDGQDATWAHCDYVGEPLIFYGTTNGEAQFVMVQSQCANATVMRPSARRKASGVGAYGGAYSLLEKRCFQTFIGDLCQSKFH
ncbi:hypothetical protein NSK_000131 [Nannochloropsis salina CCMP1776]|uniref:Uncharacterized protein n=1 Tax=Nannochloropsis salina CCMP1776 TaxID=1027361 RepID=A0A4D9DDP6_9STRA|nr:hypothetical protein NSK_000131 [Nannochloropsis salina CCMP1776]|eukprot:TFJ88557.1 hypothetical protein NSK_000131 [Nannochloropsis salina CCMP1776]